MSLGYLWDIFGISLGYLWDIFGISLGYHWNIFGISLGYLQDIFGISFVGAYLRSFSGHFFIRYTFDFGFWWYISWNKVWPKKTFWPPLAPLGWVKMSIANSSKHDNGTKNAMMRSASNMHFSAPSPLSKLCFECQGIIFNGEKVLTFSQMLTIRPEGINWLGK